MPALLPAVLESVAGGLLTADADVVAATRCIWSRLTIARRAGRTPRRRRFRRSATFRTSARRRSRPRPPLPRRTSPPQLQLSSSGIHASSCQREDMERVKPSGSALPSRNTPVVASRDCGGFAGEEFYRKAAAEIVAAQSADPTLGNREIAAWFRRSHTWVQEIVRWHTNGNDHLPFGGPGQDAAQSKSRAKKFLRDSTAEQVEEIVAPGLARGSRSGRGRRGSQHLRPHLSRRPSRRSRRLERTPAMPDGGGSRHGRALLRTAADSAPSRS